VNDEEAKETALSLWRNINLINLHENILPTKLRASLILGKNAEHEIQTVALRKL
jgi:type I pantothenate kinase